MSDEIFSQSEQATTPSNQPVPSVTPAPVNSTPDTVPPPTSSPIPSSEKAFLKKYKWLLIILAVVVIGGVGVLAYILLSVVEPDITSISTEPGAQIQSPAGDDNQPTAPADGATANPSAPIAGVENPPVINVPEQPVVQVPDAPVVEMPAAAPIVNVPQNILSPGTVSVILDATTPKTQIVSEKTTIAVAKFDLSSHVKNFKITDITLSLNDEIAPKSIEAVVLKYDGQIVYKELLSDKNVSKNFINIHGLGFEVSTMKIKSLEVVYQLAGVVSERMSGKNMQTALYSMKGVDIDNKNLSYSKIVKGNAIYVYKGYPAVSSVALSSSALVKGINTLGKFSIANKGSSKIAWKGMAISFKCQFDMLHCGLSSGNAIVTNDGLYNLEVPGPGVAVGEERQDLLVKNIGVYRLETINGVTSQLAVPGEWRFTHKTGGVVVGTFIAGADQEVSGTKTYAVKGNVLMDVLANDYMSTNLLNPSKTMLSSAKFALVNSDASLVWTDFSAINHSTESGDWHNDYLIKSLPLAVQTVKK